MFVYQLDSIIEDGIKDEEKINSTLRVMKNITTSSREISAGDLISSMDILEKIVDVTNSTGSTVAKEVKPLNRLNLESFKILWICNMLCIITTIAIKILSS